jgi:hypothetical protein
MLKAVVKNGAIHPVEPLPPDWTEGVELEVQKTSDALQAKWRDNWLTEMNALCADSTPEQEAGLDDALNELKRASKELARRRMGLSG